jgi:hypothetical protein
VKPRGGELYAFVNYYSLSCAREAAEKMSGEQLGGKQIQCKANTEPRFTRVQQQEPAPDERPPRVAEYTVKVSFITKGTTESTLFNLFSLEEIVDPERINIVDCPEDLFNHAFIGFCTEIDARRAANTLDRKRLNGSVIRAKKHPSKESQQASRKSSQPDMSIPAPPNPTQSGIRPKWQSQPKPKTSSTQQPAQVVCSCLVASIVNTKYRELLVELQRQHQVQITSSSSNCIEVYGKKERVASAEESVQCLREQVEDMVSTKKFELPCHCVPLFEKDSAMEQLKKIEVGRAVEFRVLGASPRSTFTTLASFSDSVKQCFSRETKNGSVDVIPTCLELASYFSQRSVASSSGPSTRARWFYRDDTRVFVEYTTGESARLEQMYQTKVVSPILINGNTYAFDFTTMTQRNVHTGRPRSIKRQVPLPNAERVLTLGVAGLPESFDPAIKELKSVAESAMVDKQCQLYDDSSECFKMKLMQSVSKFLVAASLVDGYLKLRGVTGYVERVHLLAEREKLSDREQQIHKNMGRRECEFPPHWKPQSEKVLLVPVLRHSDEWNKEVTKIQKTLPGATIVKLERIQNTWLWGRYSFAKERMLEINKGHVNEKHLFHGTRSTPPEKVFRSEIGVDFRFSREGLWGTGSYFAVNAAYSDSYAYSTPGGGKQMFICKVLTGDSYEAGTNTDRSLRQPPLKPATSQGSFEEQRYDSVKGYTNGSYVYVVYDHEKVYPAYLVTYTVDGVLPSYSLQWQPRPPVTPAFPNPPAPKPSKKEGCLIS